MKDQSTGSILDEEQNQNQVPLKICLLPLTWKKNPEADSPAQSPHPGDTIPPISSISESQAIPMNFGAS